ncbi:6-phosphogluconolactonase [Microvirga sp. STS02]|uniref:6-phosphogluconolactonase n=1 Tax=Hymenobacter negativus TaxID=2795026 RepID=UPI0018DD81CC|nr:MULTISPECIES: 6-phosphogluconolactonase [Bacteria]MBH8568164.1 6-phosphogluconolactonase [Hymenobacter negativus]MBR7207899.1 6-phosphogluconolactonase [Microvirga sp. STS02]
MSQHVFASVEEVLHRLADFFVEKATQAVAARGRFSVALSGGSSPKKLYELLTSPAYRERVPWAQTYFFFGDERNVPPTDAQSNYLMAKTALLAPLNIADSHVFAVNTLLPPAEAAHAYTQTINSFFGGKTAQFDLILLGLGDNSHTASLFPHTPVLHATTADVKAVFVAEVDAYRITLTAPLINQARAVAFLVFGADKAAAVRRVLLGERNIEEYPAQLIAPAAGAADWFIDESAAKELER